MGDVRKRVFGASQNAVYFADVGAVLYTNHDGIECGGGSFEVNQEASFVTFGLDRSCKHREPYQILPARLFGCVGLRVVFTAKQGSRTQQ